VQNSFFRILIISFGTFFIGGTVAAAISVHVFNTYRTAQQAQERSFVALLSTQQAILLAAREDIAILRKDASAQTKRTLDEAARLRRELAAESASRAALATETSKAAAESAAARQQLATLQETVSKSSFDVASIIAAWRPRILFIRCEWQRVGTNTTFLAKSGSGLLSRDKNGPVVYTNSHVVSNSGADPAFCSLRSSVDGTTIAVGAANISRTASLDLAIIRPQSVLGAMTASSLSTASFCSSRAAIGDELVILGYPTIGAAGDITATNGIISGYDGDYYITSAKVEQGNSGGAAILLRQSCYLGLPTFVELGNIEALARILDARKFLQ